MTAAVTEASLRGQIRATEEIIAAEQKQLELIQRQFELGGVARLGVLILRTQLDQTRATLPPLERNLCKRDTSSPCSADTCPARRPCPSSDSTN